VTKVTKVTLRKLFDPDGGRLVLPKQAASSAGLILIPSPWIMYWARSFDAQLGWTP